MTVTAGCSCPPSSAAASKPVSQNLLHLHGALLPTRATFHWLLCIFLTFAPLPFLQTETHLIHTLAQLCALCYRLSWGGDWEREKEKRADRELAERERPMGYVTGFKGRLALLPELGKGKFAHYHYLTKRQILSEKRILQSSLKPSSQVAACVNTPTRSQEHCSIPKANRFKKTTAGIVA